MTAGDDFVNKKCLVLEFKFLHRMLSLPFSAVWLEECKQDLDGTI